MPQVTPRQVWITVHNNCITLNTANERHLVLRLNKKQPHLCPITAYNEYYNGILVSAADKNMSLLEETPEFFKPVSAKGQVDFKGTLVSHNINYHTETVSESLYIYGQL